VRLLREFAGGFAGEFAGRNDGGKRCWKRQQNPLFCFFRRGVEGRRLKKK
jgi:hypothetical protein